MSRRIVLPAPASLLLPTDSRWPRALADLPSPPQALLLGGRLPPLERAVAIVGTRFADAEALSFTRKLAGTLAGAGVTVVSGGAEGVDAAAHEGALAAGGCTLSVLATSLVTAFPAHHGPLFSAIARQGALLCEQPKVVGKHAFLRRNRLIAALCEAVVVVQAPVRSGALSTAAWAKRLKRQVFAVPSAPWDARGQGCLGLLSSGARICTSAADVLSLRAHGAGQVALPGLVSDEESSDDAHFDRGMRRVLELVGEGPKHPDELATRLAWPAARVHEALLILELSGRVQKREGGLYGAVLD